MSDLVDVDYRALLQMRFAKEDVKEDVDYRALFIGLFCK